MESTADRAIAIVGVGAVLPDAPDVPTFWDNVKNSRDSITEVTPDRWDPALYYDSDPKAPDKTYSKIGGWVREHVWEPMKWRLPIPPRVANAMDEAQQWAVSSTRAALEDYGYPKRPLDAERTAVILGSAIAGEKQYFTVLRAYFPEIAHELEETGSFAALPAAVRDQLSRELRQRIGKRFPEITEDTMPGELANCIAGRITNLFNFRGPNYVCDAACASAMAAINSAVEGLVENKFDVAVTGGIDRNMGPSTYIKFCKIGALSATGSRPYADGADGFVMGEGAAIFLFKRLADAERDGDNIYAVLRGVGGSSDGKGKGITAPNPIGQKICMERAWQNAGLSPATATMIEGHGTSTSVGDAVELQSMVDVLKEFNLPTASIALGSVKSNFGHLKGAAGAAGLLKATLALRDKVLPPSVHGEHPNSNIDFAHAPIYVNTKLKPWDVPKDVVRRAGVSAFGFGGTNFHLVLEEYIPHKLTGNGKRSIAVGDLAPAAGNGGAMIAKSNSPTSYDASSCKPPLRGALVIGAESETQLADRLHSVHDEAKQGRAPAVAAPLASDLRAAERLAIDYVDTADLAGKSATALKALAANQPAMWKALRAQGIFRGHGPAGKVAFLYTGQGSQYVNMMQPLRAIEPIVAETFAEADRVMTPLLGKPLSDYIFVDSKDATAVERAEEDLRQTAITQPAVLATDTAMTRLLAAYGIQPDMTMGHSLGEYGALIASGGIPFADALEAVCARGREMTRVSFADNGLMAAVFAPVEEIERILKSVSGYVVIANINSDHQGVIGGATKAVEQAMDLLQKAGYEVAPLTVSQAFHTSIVAPASEPLRQVLSRLRLQSPRLPIVANVNGEFYPTGADAVPKMLDILAQQVAAPVQFAKGLRTLYDAGVRVYVETGPKKALHGFVEDVLGERGDVVSVFTNHPKVGDVASFNQALCGLYAAGLGRGIAEAQPEAGRPVITASPVPAPVAIPQPVAYAASAAGKSAATTPLNGDRMVELGRMFADVLERGWQMYHGEHAAPPSPVVITGAALGLPGTERIFDDANIARILRGEQFIDLVPAHLRRAMLDKNITRLVKSDNGGRFETITDVADVIKLAGRGGALDLVNEFGVSADRFAALDRVTSLAIAAGIDALRDAGIPLVLRYKTTTKGTQLPDRWGLPDAMRDDTGVIFGSAFPGCDSFADEMARFYADHSRREQVALLEEVRSRLTAGNGQAALSQEIKRRIDELKAAIEKEPYVFDRRFLFRVLPMGHSQFAEFIGARGPNTQINAACASTAQAVSLAEDWIRAGRCRRVVILSADDITSDHLMGWFGAGFLATGAAATDEVVEDTAIPFDRRRHGMIIGMGAAAIVVESAEAARERGIQPICEVLSAVTANSAFHGTRLDVQHIGGVMETLMAQAETRYGINRHQIAEKTVFVSHETYTPARGGSASAEIHSLRRVFGESADRIVIANTKGFTGHAMATGIEDVVAIKALETGCVPPVANFKEVDPELGALNLSKGGSYPVEYAIRLGAGFGSQISMTLMRWVANKDGVRRDANSLGYAYRIVDENAWHAWLSRIAGRPAVDLEVVRHTLRVRDQAARPQVEAAQKVTISTEREISTNVPRGTTVDSSETSAKLAPVAAAVAVAPAPAPPVVKVEAKPAPPPPVAKTEAKPAVAPPPSKPPEPIREAKAAPPASVTLPQPASKEAVKESVLALVVEKTGYPKDMLDLDLDLEADLGVDTVKQAELFAAIRSLYNIPRDENLRLRDFPTLAHVIRFVFDKRPDLADVSPQQPAKELAAVATPATVATAPVTREEVPSTPAPAANAAISADAVKESVLALVVEKTGYPKDMLDLDLDLEADLGVDTVKQAELFAAIRGLYNIPRDENLKLRDFPTLAHVIKFVFDKRPDLVAEAPAMQTKEVTPVTTPAAVATAAVTREEVPSTPAPAANAATSAADTVKESVLALVVEKTGYPKDMLDLDLDLEADLGVDTVKQAELFAAIRGLYNIPRDENLKLREFPTLAHVIRFVYDRRPDLVAATSPQAAKKAEPAVEPVAVAATAREEVPSTPALTTQSADGAADAVKESILALVVEKTGYPKDMLDLELDLEADLGVDTVKQAELFAAIRGLYNIPRDENLKLRDFPTLAHVIQFVYDKRPDLASAVAPTPAPTAEPTPSPSPSVPPPAQASDEAIRDKVLDIVAEKTGYPKEMLDLDLDLEADLGIDTVKQAEMFAAIRAAYKIPRDENLKLRDFPTLAHVIKFAREGQMKLAPTPASETSGEPDVTPKPPVSAAPTAPARALPNLTSLEAANRIPRRVPVPTPRPSLAISKPTAVKLGRGSRVVIMSDAGGVGDALAQQLRGMEVEVLSIEHAPDTAAVADLLKKWMAAGPIQGIYWLPALDKEKRLADMDAAAWHEAIRVRVKLLYASMRTLYQQIAPTGTFLVSATRLGGMHGYDEAGAFAPLGGAVVGFTKTYQRERIDALVKAVDFEAERNPSDIAKLLIAESLRDPGAVEIGHRGDQRWTVGLQEKPAADGQPGFVLNPDTVFAVTGAAGSIVSAITADLAAASGGTFYLLDLVPEPDPNNPDLKRFVSDRDGLKRDLFARMQARGERATPALVEKELAALERAQAAVSAIEAVRAAGGTAHYFSVNLADADAVATVIEQVRKRSGRIDVLLHAAGLERSHFLPDKEPAEFDLVFDVKSDGWFNLLHAIGDMPLGATVAFSSIAGRFGNAGQADYSAANDLLCKMTSSFRTTRPATRGIVIDWTAWGGIGMATRGSIPKMMELAGIDMLPPEAGIPLIRRELTAGGTRGEIVIGQRFGILLSEYDPTGGVEATAFDASTTAHGPMLGKVASMGVHSGLTIETTLDPKVQPFLRDHQIDGTPVLPGVMGIEAFAEAALAMLPGWHIEAVEDVNFLAPFKFYRHEPRTVTIHAVLRPEDDAIVAECRLTGSRQLPTQLDPQVTTHFTARVRLVKQAPQSTTGPAPDARSGSVTEAGDIYRIFFHGPAYQVVERAWRNDQRIIGELSRRLPANHHPSERPLVIAPRLIELCFQTAGLWEIGVHGRFGLPQHVDRVCVGRAAPGDAELLAVATPDPGGNFDVEVVDRAGNRYVQLTGYRTVALPNAVEAGSLKALQTVA
jgi:acyl transferase domain-containing protein/NAD(P)-dependent dehydrogenase (short-subunit alcohol dehydrogenase family)